MTNHQRKFSIPLIAWALAAFAGGCGGAPGSGVRRHVEPFHAIEIDGAMNVAVESAADSAIRLAAGEAEVSVRSGVLFVTPAGGTVPDVEVRTAGLGRISVAGDGDVRIDLDPDSRERLVLSVSGSGRVVIRGVRAELVRLEVGGAPEVEVAGSAGRLEVASEGAGALDLGGLCVETADVELDGAGRVTVTAEARVDARIAGGGLLRYHAPHDLPAPEGGEVERLADAGACGR